MECITDVECIIIAHALIVPVDFASVVPLIEISGIQVCGWLYEVSELSACDILSVKLAHHTCIEWTVWRLNVKTC